MCLLAASDTRSSGAVPKSDWYLHQVRKNSSRPCCQVVSCLAQVIVRDEELNERRRQGALL
jgi:hypothetical protein